jgi:hypothetical protein
MSARRPVILAREIPLPVLPKTAEGWSSLLLGIGVLLRLAAYAEDRSLWMDESSLRSNIVDHALVDFSRPLKSDQLAPVGFLVIERAIAHTLGGSALALRLVPLACGIGSLFLFRDAARRCLAPSAIPVAMAIFSLSEDLIYFATELKPYSSDVTIALALLLAGDLLPRGGWTWGRLGVALAIGLVVPWLSYPSVFVLAGVGSVWILTALGSGHPALAATLLVVCLGWLGGLALAYRASRALMGVATSMWVFWDFAFLRLPPRSLADARQLGDALLNLFVNPFHFATPLGPLGSALIGWTMILGAKVRQSWLWTIIITFGGVMGAAAARQYPFHGRLVLFLVPGMILLVASGIDRVRQHLWPRLLGTLFLGFVLLYPAATAVYHLVDHGTERVFDPHGDLRRDRFPPPP